MLSFSFLSLVIWVFSFFLDLSRVLSILLVFFEEPTFSYVDFIYCISIIYFINSSSNRHYFSFLRPALGLVFSSFSSFLRQKVRLLSSFFFFKCRHVFYLLVLMLLLQSMSFVFCGFISVYSKYFIISLMILSLTHWLFRSMLIFTYL